MTLITIIIGGSITIIVSGSDKIAPRAMWSLAAISTLIGAIFSWYWYKLMIMSNVWIQFWRRKIQLFEIGQSPNNSNYWFMRERVTSNDEFIERLSIDKESSETQEAIKEYKKWYDKLPKGSGGVSDLFMGLIVTLGAILLLMSIVCICLAVFEIPISD